jgi:glycyl-tRNA synthetase beta chain
MNFLFEIGLEEIPARMIAAAQGELARRIEDVLTRERLLDAGHETHSHSTPRRLAVLVKGVIVAQADTQEQLTGPSWNIAFKNGESTPAAHAFAKKAGVEVAALQKINTPKGEYVSAVIERKGRSASEILVEQLPKELAALYWPKNMYWRAGKPERFVRPLKWLLALLDHAIVPVEFAGVHAANLTYGHRILHGDAALTVEHATDYLGVLEAAHVTADVELRRDRIRKGLDAATRTIPGARWREDEALVDTVTHLTEWPAVLLGSFDPEYLTLPEEVLVTVMRDHQKYFAVEDAHGKLAPWFLTVLNTQPSEHADEIIRHGNERVLRARFNDARFFWTVDQKIPLTERVEMQKSVTFQKDLGSYYAKTEANLRIAERLSEIVTVRGTNLEKAALLTAVRIAKTDLTAELVKEFTELQGIVGGLYARAQGLGETVAQAIYWQYSPAAIEDPIPPTVEGQIFGIADRFQTIAAMFGIGLEPTGSKDPFGLRRAANGIVKILAESGLPLRISDLLAVEDGKLSAFFRERVEFYLRDVRGFAYGVVNAVLAPGFDDVRDAIARAEALTAVRGSEDFIAISAAFKRIKNILRQANVDSHSTIDPDKLVELAERSLYDHMNLLMLKIHPIRTDGYGDALEQIATLRPHVDLFFDKVMVMAEDPAIRANRLALIANVLGSFSSIADFSEVVTS